MNKPVCYFKQINQSCIIKLFISLMIFFKTVYCIVLYPTDTNGTSYDLKLRD